MRPDNASLQLRNCRPRGPIQQWAVAAIALWAAWTTALSAPPDPDDSSAQSPQPTARTDDEPADGDESADTTEPSEAAPPPSADQTFGPAGAAGPSGVWSLMNTDPSDGFLPIADRWRIGFPEYDRLGRRSVFDAFTMGAVSGNYQYVPGHWWDPYNQNVFKGDYPIIGRNTFLNTTFTSDTLIEYRRVPTPSGESTAQSDSPSFFGDSQQTFVQQNFIARIDLFHGAAAFKPFDWRFRLTPVMNLNYLKTEELGVVGIDVRREEQRERRDFTIQEAFLEAKLADLSPNYDFVNVRVGRQPFVSDFRGFIFNDVNDGVRLFGNDDANRRQWNLLYFYQAEKETNSDLNTFDARHQNVVVMNYYLQDSLDFEFLPPSWRKGYTSQFSYHFNYDDQNDRELHFDKNGFLVRPDPIGSFKPHDVKVSYFGFAGDGHIGRLNLTHAFYWAAGRDDFNAIAGQRVTINAQMYAVEASVDLDWFRVRSSFLWASGDRRPQDRQGRAFDAIFDNPNFAGGPFSFWNRQAIKLLGVNLVNRNSLLPDLTSSKTEGQANFVNPGLFLANVGADADITPKVKAIFNANYLWFAYTEPLELYLQQADIRRDIGAEASVGLQYRPLLNNNVIINVGVSAFWPGNGFEQILETEKTLYSVFTSMTLTF